MKTTRLSIDANIFQKMLSMSIDDMHELIETVGVCASLNRELSRSSEKKIIAGITMMRRSITLLEQCDCSVVMSIENSKWTSPVDYSTGTEFQEE